MVTKRTKFLNIRNHLQNLEKVFDLIEKHGYSSPLVKDELLKLRYINQIILSEQVDSKRIKIGVDL